MFIVLLRFSDNKHLAPQFMDGHKAWLQHGFDDKVFLLSGSLSQGAGGAVLAHGTSLPALQARVDEDPFVAEHIVRVEIIEIAAARADERLSFLLS